VIFKLNTKVIKKSQNCELFLHLWTSL